MRASGEVRVVVAAGGLGTRVHRWARYLPKEFHPVCGRPGITWILEEIAGLGAAHIVIVYHPYYRAFTEWAGQALSSSGEARYRRAAGRPMADHEIARGPAISFMAQQGRYGDLTSVLNGADHFPAAEDLYVAFADNLYFGPNALLALRNVPPGQVAVVARSYQPELAAWRGVIATVKCDGRRLVAGLTREAQPECGLCSRTTPRRRKPAAPGGQGAGHCRLHPLRPRIPDRTGRRAEAGPDNRRLRCSSSCRGRRD